jgi:threonine aldolase
MEQINPRGFASDNNSGVHPSIMQALANVNHGHVVAYGNDHYSKSAIEKFKNIFGKDIAVYFLYNGTGANVLALKSVTESWQSILCSEVAHIYEDECGAPEKITGCKLVPLPHLHGKISIEGIHKHLVWLNDEHRVQPRVVSITQSTEMGGVYTLEEIKAISKFCKENDLLLHMDGARLSNAAIKLGLDYVEFTKNAGVDILSFGGTKNGMMFGEAVIFFNQDDAKHSKYFRKQNMQLNSKMRYIAAQFDAYLETDVWKKNAQNANEKAQYLYNAVKDIPQINVVHPVESNGVFAIIPTEITAELQKEVFFYVFDEHANMVRWMCSWDTTTDDIDRFVKRLKELLKA